MYNYGCKTTTKIQGSEGNVDFATFQILNILWHAFKAQKNIQVCIRKKRVESI